MLKINRTIKVDPELWVQAKKIAKKQYMSLSALIAKLLREHIENS